MPHIGKKLKLILSLVIVSLSWGLLVCFTNDNIEVISSISLSDSTQLFNLGKHLFYDNRLSYNSTKSCASCHDQRFAFTDGYRKSIGIYGDNVKHNSLPLFNLDQNISFNWNDPGIKNIEDQLLIPLFNISPHELGLKEHEQEILLRFIQDTTYVTLFRLAFPEINSPININSIIKSLACFCLSIKSYNSDYDRGRLSTNAQKGKGLFYSKKYQCDKCHSGPNFNQIAGAKLPEDNFQRFGTIENYIYNNDTDLGLFEKSNKTSDKFKFRIPSLRNLSYTSPYLHDGSAANLMEVLNIYDNANSSSNFEFGLTKDSVNITKQERLKNTNMTMEDKLNLIAFLLSLNDTTLINDSRYQNPFNY